jgi:hypothetical protein
MLKFYIISTLISIFVVRISVLAINSKLKREGYKYNKIKYSLTEKIQGYIALFVPILNILLALISLFFYEKIYNEAVEKCRCISHE